MKRISIAVTTYQGQQYVAEQLQSLLCQNRTADEVVILDDCSTDGTAGIIEAFIREHRLENWQFHVNRQNLGYKRNFYEAVSRTTGDLIFLCDQDDIWNPEKLERMEKDFERRPDACAINSSFSLIDGAGRPFNSDAPKGTLNHGLIRMRRGGEAIIKIPLWVMMRGNISPGCTMAFTAPLRTVFLKKSKSLVHHDADLNILAALQDGLYYDDTPFIRYRIHGKNTLGLTPLVSRLDVAQVQLETAELMSSYCTEGLNRPLVEQFLCFSEDRKAALQGRAFSKLIGLYQRYGKLYRLLYTPKQRAGDIGFILKKGPDDPKTGLG